MKKTTSEIFDSFNNKGDVLFERMTGSRLYGTSYELGENPHDPNYVSDWDYRGVFMINPMHKLKLSPFNKFSPTVKLKEDDTEFYEIEKFMEEAVKNNPNYMDLIFGDDESLIFASDKGNYILEHKHDFLCEKIINSFIGYAQSQLSRIKNHNRWLNQFPYIYEVEDKIQLAYNNKDIDFYFISNNFSGKLAKYITGLNEQSVKEKGSISLEEFAIKYFPNAKFDVLSYAKPHVINYLNIKTNEGIQLPLNESIKHFLFNNATFTKSNESLYFIYENGKGIFSPDRGVLPKPSVKIGNLAIKYIMTVDYNLFKSMQNDISDLWEWRVNRNPKRSILEKKYGYDVKHGMHTYRLLDSAIDVCETGTYTPRLKGERLQNAKDILAGEWTYDFLLDNANEKISLLRSYKNKSVLKPDIDMVKLSKIYNTILFEN